MGYSQKELAVMGVGVYASALLSKEVGLPVPFAMLLGASVAGLVAALRSPPAR